MKKFLSRGFMYASAIAVMLLIAAPAQAQPSEPDLTVCDGVDCNVLPLTVCDPGGFQVSLTNFLAAEDPNNFEGGAIYTYEICSPPEGVCSLDAGKTCLSNEDCSKHGAGDCSRDCAVDVFRGLSHFNIDFPDLGGSESCLTEDNFVGGTCSCKTGSSTNCAVDQGVVLGDGSCFDSTSTVAKCDNTNLDPGDCIEMVLEISGETNDLGLGAAIVVSKESGDCNTSCLAGPSCDRCDEPPTGGGGECLTRTQGFWGTHPWHTNDYDPVTVCGETVGCFGAADGISSPSCPASSCDSIMEAMGSNGGELNNASSYIALIRQLTTAKINLAATDAVAPGALCSDWTYQNKSIQAWIEACESPSHCNGSQGQIENSGCIDALDAFNNSLDTGFPAPPAPFDRPPVDDFGNISGADPSGWTASKNSGYVIGRNVPGGANCQAP